MPSSLETFSGTLSHTPRMLSRAPISVRLGKRIRAIRIQRGYTQTQLADRLEIEASFIRDVERGRVSMSLSSFETIAQGLRMTLAELTTGL